MRDPLPRETHGLILITKYLHQEAGRLSQLFVRKNSTNVSPEEHVVLASISPPPRVCRDGSSVLSKPRAANWLEESLAEQTKLEGVAPHCPGEGHIQGV